MEEDAICVILFDLFLSWEISKANLSFFNCLASYGVCPSVNPCQVNISKMFFIVLELKVYFI